MDLTVEAVVHDNAEWHELFTENELRLCKRRLAEFGYFETGNQ